VKAPAILVDRAASGRRHTATDASARIPRSRRSGECRATVASSVPHSRTADRASSGAARASTTRRAFHVGRRLACNRDSVRYRGAALRPVEPLKVHQAVVAHPGHQLCGPAGIERSSVVEHEPPRGTAGDSAA